MATFKNCVNCGGRFDTVTGIGVGSNIGGCCSSGCYQEMKRKREHDAQMLQAAQSQPKVVQTQQSSSSGSGIGDAVGTAAVGTAATVAVAAGGLAFGAGKALVDAILAGNRNHEEKLKAIDDLEIPKDPTELKRLFFSLRSKINWNAYYEAWWKPRSITEIMKMQKPERTKQLNEVVVKKLEVLTTFWKVEAVNVQNYEQTLLMFEEELKKIEEERKKAIRLLLMAIVGYIALLVLIANNV